MRLPPEIDEQKFHCPKCGRSLRGRVEDIGAVCPGCGRFTIYADLVTVQRRSSQFRRWVVPLFLLPCAMLIAWFHVVHGGEPVGDDWTVLAERAKEILAAGIVLLFVLAYVAARNRRTVLSRAPAAFVLTLLWAAIDLAIFVGYVTIVPALAH